MDWEEFQADDSIQAFFAWHEVPSLLTLRGKIIDTVSNYNVLFDPLFDFVDEEQLERDTFIHYRRLAVLLDSCKQLFLSSASSNNDNVKAECYWRALIGGLDINSNLANGIY